MITGVGVVSPIGIGREAFWRSLENHTSGVRAIEKMDEIKRMGVRAFLPKPYTAERLLEAVAESLAGHPIKL